MIIEKDRLLSLIEFTQQSARLRGKPAATVAAHGLFALYEHELQGLPGIRINVNGPESEDEIWLAVERLHETRPPEIANAVLRPWVADDTGTNGRAAAARRHGWCKSDRRRHALFINAVA